MSHSKGIYEKYIKRLLDVILSLCALIVLSPILAIIAVVVRIKLGKPIIFTQKRPGKNEKIFKLYKFRSMIDKYDKNGEPLPDDLRITKFGKKLRSTSLDELPELYNILIGNMSIVGPRPLLVEYLPYYLPEERKRHNVRPGLTGLAQISGRNTSTWEEKFQYDLQYVNHISFVNDVKIILTTIKKTIKRADVLVGSEIPAGRLDDYRRSKKDV